MNNNSSFSHQQHEGANLPTLMVHDNAVAARQPIGRSLSADRPQQFVGDVRQDVSDAERERHISSCGWLMEDAMRRYYETGCFSHRGEADRWRLLMEEAIRGRSQAQVARMERQKGLR